MPRIIIKAGQDTTASPFTITGQDTAAIAVKNRGANILMVSIEPIHAGEFDELDPGDERVYRSTGGQITTITAKAKTGTTDFLAVPVVGKG